MSDWEYDKLNVNESHKAITEKLKTLSNNGVISNSYFTDFDYVKQKRWIADYNICNVSALESDECILKATSFMQEVESLTV